MKKILLTLLLLGSLGVMASEADNTDSVSDDSASCCSSGNGGSNFLKDIFASVKSPQGLSVLGGIGALAGVVSSAKMCDSCILNAISPIHLGEKSEGCACNHNDDSDSVLVKVLNLGGTVGLSGKISLNITVGSVALVSGVVALVAKLAAKK